MIRAVKSVPDSLVSNPWGEYLLFCLLSFPQPLLRELDLSFNRIPSLEGMKVYIYIYDVVHAVLMITSLLLYLEPAKAEAIGCELEPADVPFLRREDSETTDSVPHLPGRKTQPLEPGMGVWVYGGMGVWRYGGSVLLIEVSPLVSMVAARDISSTCSQ